MKLNMGCGTNHKPKEEGWINVDKHAPADKIVDLERSFLHEGRLKYDFWPWDNSSVDEVLFHHSLEHMGQQASAFFHIMQELHRVCANDAKVTITVPHFRHDDFSNDPTHVRIITPNILAMFSRLNTDQWEKDGNPNTPLARHLGVNFNIEKCEDTVEQEYCGLPEEHIREAIRRFNNVVKYETITLKVVK